MSFSDFVIETHRAGRLTVQPRMGFSSVDEMRQGLLAVRDNALATIGTVTLDSYTRVGDHETARAALQLGSPLNGFPLVAHGPAVARGMLDGVQARHFPVQVRHGSALPQDIFATLIAAGFDATEGGPVSYCLPYGRVPLDRSIAAWRECCQMLAEHEAKTGKAIHLESFGGCMLGQLCPPSLLIAISILEGLFFMHHGVRDLSLSYAQQVSFRQDLAAIKVLRGLADRFLHGSRLHVVLYTYMGVFPRTVGGASDLLAQSARLAAAGGAMRLIVKTPAEAHRIPTVQENIASLEHASEVYESSPRDLTVDQALVDEIGEEALSLIEATLNLDANLDIAIGKAFASGLLDVPYCLHDDNANVSRAFIDQRGLLRWQSPGRMPIRIGKRQEEQMIDMVDPFAFLGMLKSIERRYDAPYLAAPNPIFVTARAEA